ncbi:hypothetical protein [Gimesia sp.]|nr:hypothetical protein [Gimesia sp.]|tara:strand:+ start:627 stop:752 length:126 start_codon:yes stop_codon:yes gene_type:complete
MSNKTENRKGIEITIVPDEELQRLAQKSMEIQVTCNYSGMV